MSRSSAATNAGRRAVKRSPAPAAARRVSGPVAAPRHDPNAHAYADASVAAVPRQRRLAYGGVAIASRVAEVAIDVSASRTMDRLVRSRVWIGIIAFGLIGIVAMQVSMLKINSGIGRAVQTASTLERKNAALRGEVSRLSAGERIVPLAKDQGLVMPAPADVGYLRAESARSAAVRAARRMRAPDLAVAGLAGRITTPGGLGDGVTPATGSTPATVAPAPGATPTATPPAPAPVTTGTGGSAPVSTGGVSPAAPAAVPRPAAGGAAVDPAGVQAGGAPATPAAP